MRKPRRETRNGKNPPSDHTAEVTVGENADEVERKKALLHRPWSALLK